jgi:hypothetical protein
LVVKVNKPRSAIDTKVWVVVTGQKRLEFLPFIEEE